MTRPCLSQGSVCLAPESGEHQGLLLGAQSFLVCVCVCALLVVAEIGVDTAQGAQGRICLSLRVERGWWAGGRRQRDPSLCRAHPLWTGSPK